MHCDGLMIRLRNHYETREEAMIFWDMLDRVKKKTKKDPERK
jgi:hypothetical protein